MIPAGTKDAQAQGAAAKAQPPTKPNDPVQACVSCTVTIAPSPVNLCNTKTEKRIKATGTPSGGSFTWTCGDPDVAKVTGSRRTAKVKGLKAGQTTITVTYSVSGCTCSEEVAVSVCTCTPKPKDGRWYAYAAKNIDNVVGVRAKIETRWGKLCCEDELCSRTDAFFAAYANAGRPRGKDQVWAQFGFTKSRNAGSTSTVRTRYAEKNGALYRIFHDKDNPPAEGSVHLYQIELDLASGKWTYYDNGVEFRRFSDAQWVNKTATNISFAGELVNKEDDMPGTDSDKCEFTECQYLEKRGEPEEEKTPAEVLSDFGFDKSNLNPEHQDQIDVVAAQVALSWEMPPEIVKVRLVGHTDAVGSPGYNIGLGQRRALAARGALAKALDAQQGGLSAKVKLVTESKGESQLIDNSGTPEGDAKNRRVEIFLTTRAPVPEWQDAGLAAADVITDDNSEWGAEWVSATAFNIWDKQPLP